MKSLNNYISEKLILKKNLNNIFDELADILYSPKVKNETHGHYSFTHVEKEINEWFNQYKKEFPSNFISTVYDDFIQLGPYDKDSSDWQNCYGLIGIERMFKYSKYKDEYDLIITLAGNDTELKNFQNKIKEFFGSIDAFDKFKENLIKSQNLEFIQTNKSALLYGYKKG
jgi:hypothetical protein